MKQIDLRSDTVTKPSTDMLDAMITANVGDDVYGEDPTVNELETLAAKITGTQRSIFCTSGTQSNLLALLAHCERGEEYIVGQHAHTYKYEGGGAAVLGSIQPQPLDFEDNGTLSLETVSQFIKPEDFHFARTKLLCLENTHNGKVLPLDYLTEARTFVDKNNLMLHLDGARVFNAAVQQEVDIKEIAQHFDTISCCLSKGLGAPVGSVLCGSRNVISKARRWRKVLGGGMRQAGILAAAGIYALSNNISRLKQDHENSLALARGLSIISDHHIHVEEGQTNIIFADIKAEMKPFCDYLKTKGIIIGENNHLRLVTHMDISREDIDVVINAFKDYFI